MAAAPTSTLRTLRRKSRKRTLWRRRLYATLVVDPVGLTIPTSPVCPCFRFRLSTNGPGSLSIAKSSRDSEPFSRAGLARSIGLRAIGLRGRRVKHAPPSTAIASFPRRALSTAVEARRDGVHSSNPPCRSGSTVNQQSYYAKVKQKGLISWFERRISVVLWSRYTGCVRLKFRNLRRDWTTSLPVDRSGLARARNGQILSDMGCL
jgi:hypothetical protein